MAFINVEDEQVIKDLYRLNVFLCLFVIDKLDTHSPIEDDEVIKFWKEFRRVLFRSFHNVMPQCALGYGPWPRTASRCHLLEFESQAMTSEVNPSYVSPPNTYITSLCATAVAPFLPKGVNGLCFTFIQEI